MSSRRIPFLSAFALTGFLAFLACDKTHYKEVIIELPTDPSNTGAIYQVVLLTTDEIGNPFQDPPPAIFPASRTDLANDYLRQHQSLGEGERVVVLYYPATGSDPAIHIGKGDPLPTQPDYFYQVTVGTSSQLVSPNQLRSGEQHFADLSEGVKAFLPNLGLTYPEPIAAASTAQESPTQPAQNPQTTPTPDQPPADTTSGAQVDIPIPNTPPPQVRAPAVTSNVSLRLHLIPFFASGQPYRCTECHNAETNAGSLDLALSTEHNEDAVHAELAIEFSPPTSASIRIRTSEPIDSSLLLLKPLAGSTDGRDRHEGGDRFPSMDDPYYQMIRAWIKEGGQNN